MNKLSIAEAILLLVTFVILPSVALWLSQKICRLENISRGRQISLYVAVVASASSAWWLAQLYLPLAFVGIALVPFLVSWLGAKITLQKSLLLALSFAVIYIILDVAVTYGYLSLTLHK